MSQFRLTNNVTLAHNSCLRNKYLCVSIIWIVPNNVPIEPQIQIDLADAYAVKTPQDSRRLYAQWAQTYNETFINANKYVYPRAVAELFAKHVSEIAITAVVDIGCGTGAVGSYLANLRPNITIDGYDISPEMLAQAALTRLVTTSRAQNVLKDSYTPSDELAKEIQDHVKATIAPYKYPRLIEFRNELPKTATGKMQRYRLRSEAADDKR